MISVMEKNYFAAIDFRLAPALSLGIGGLLSWSAAVVGPFTGSVVGMATCFWYPKAGQIPACELEPHGTRNNIPPGGSASFTEDWYLLPHPFPAAGAELDLDNLAAQVAREAR